AAQPQEKRHVWLSQIVRQVLRRFQVDFLNHVRGVDPALQALVEAKGDHAAQSVRVPRQQSAPGFLVAICGRTEQSVGFAVITGHQGHHGNLIARGVPPETGKMPGSRNLPRWGDEITLTPLPDLVTLVKKSREIAAVETGRAPHGSKWRAAYKEEVTCCFEENQRLPKRCLES